MNYTTQNLTKTNAGYKPGICKIFIIPLGVLPIPSPHPLGLYAWPGGVTYALFGDFNIVAMDLVQDSFKFLENPKESKAGQYYDVSISGESNSMDALTRQTLETLSLQPVQVLLINRSGRNRIVGTADRGLDLQFKNENDNNGVAMEKVSIVIAGQTETTAPFTTFTL